MTKRSSGLIVTVSSMAGAKHLFSVPYATGKTAVSGGGGEQQKKLRVLNL